jgi:antitoxin component YwqK of YwqJK toxin-antitoxin module
LDEELLYVNGTMEGAVKAYYQNGNLKFKGQNKNDLPHGDWVAFYETGEKQMEYSFDNGVEQGTIISY